MWGDVQNIFSFLPAYMAVDVQTCNVWATLVMSVLTFWELGVTVQTPLLLCSSFLVNEKRGSGVSLH